MTINDPMTPNTANLKQKFYYKQKVFIFIFAVVDDTG